MRRAQRLLRDRTVWNVSSTAAGGGVAEVLQTQLAYARGCDIDARWVVLQGNPEFFAVTKRIHNGLHGRCRDGDPLAEREYARYVEVLHRNAEQLRAVVRPRDVVILHDPQTAGLVSAMRQTGAVVIWRCHIGHDITNEVMERTWAFLRPCLEGAHGFVFSRAAYVPPCLNSGQIHIIPPSIDAFSVKNQPMSPSTARAIMARIGLLEASAGNGAPVFTRRDGSTARVNRRAHIVHAGRLPGPNVPVVVQVSRWDRLKDMIGVMQGFAEYVQGLQDVHLMLVGPDVQGVIDDPEGGEVLDECIAAWHKLPRAQQSRVQIVCLPM
ncbi:MAG: glycosyl transferase family 1, partial [Candidatus Methylomirabilales bacterium]